MGKLWTKDRIGEYHTFMASFISTYKQKIDCADLALEGLVEFAYEKGLPLKLKYYDAKAKKWRHFESPKYEAMDPTKPVQLVETLKRNAEKRDAFKSQVKINLGAENVIDNTVKIDPSQALAGDFIMTRRPGQMGHTRVIHTMAPMFNPATQELDYVVVWYQGTVPPEVPSERRDYFSHMLNTKDSLSGGPVVHEGKPRRWNFEAFEK